MAPIKPNRSYIEALVEEYETADDSFGGWAHLQLKNISEFGESESLLEKQLIGTTIKAFVPPPLTNKISYCAGKNTIYSGVVTIRGDGMNQIYALVPPLVSRQKK